MSNNIKKLRLEQNLTQSELAAIAGVSDKAVSTWEQGLKNPRKSAINKLAYHFNVSPAWLEGYTNDPTNYNDPELITQIPQSILQNFNGDVQKAYTVWKSTEAEYVSEGMLDIVNSLDDDILEKYGSDISRAYAEQRKRDMEQAVSTLESLSSKEKELLTDFLKLNEQGKDKAIEYVKDLSSVDKYRK